MEETKNAVPQVTLGEAKRVIAALAPAQSVLLLSAPSIGKSAAVQDG